VRAYEVALQRLQHQRVRARRPYSRFAALTHRIARTDHLIDQIVYRLHGLTGEEIASVEGRA
jgi:hypothetical protein